MLSIHCSLRFDLVWFISTPTTAMAMSAMWSTVLALLDRPMVICFDDLHWSRGMEYHWLEVCSAQEKVAAVLDFEWWGVAVLDPLYCGPALSMRLSLPRYLDGCRVEGLR